MNVESIQFGVYKTKLILFCPKQNLKNPEKLKKMYKSNMVTYLSCLLNKKMSGELIALKTSEKKKIYNLILYIEIIVLIPVFKSSLTKVIVWCHNITIF